ncbi:hypothetical protein TNCT6_21240 [Streptomyces sp. 6-11-2]|nr:hypothetical protein TNCT6_21240 [Streptomyces sp. 6-11-2]
MFVSPSVWIGQARPGAFPVRAAAWSVWRSPGAKPTPGIPSVPQQGAVRALVYQTRDSRLPKKTGRSVGGETDRPEGGFPP